MPRKKAKAILESSMDGIEETIAIRNLTENLEFLAA